MTCGITATVLADMWPNVAIEPLLQAFPMLITRHASTITDDNARLNVCVNRVWGSNRHQSACLDVKIFNSNTPSYCNSQPQACYI